MTCLRSGSPLTKLHGIFSFFQYALDYAHGCEITRQLLYLLLWSLNASHVYNVFILTPFLLEDAVHWHFSDREQRCMAIDIVCLRTSIKDQQIESESLESEVDTFNCCHICPPLSYPVVVWNRKHAKVGLFFCCFLNLLNVPEHCWSTYSQINDSCWGIMLSTIPFFSPVDIFENLTLKCTFCTELRNYLLWT